MLFGALSPAFAALTFAGRQDVLGRLLGAPVTLDATSFCATTPDGAGAHATDNGTGPHAAHDVYCLFCLASASTVTLTGGSLVAPAMAHAGIMPDATERSHTPQSARALHYARGPPTTLQYVW